MSSVNHDDLAHLKIPLENILSATNNFAKRNFIGGDDFGNHYAGQLMWSGELIDIHARRWLNKERDDEKEQQFWMEISMLYTLKHKNIVSIIGFCDENDELITVIKLETRASLNNYLSDTMKLTWVRRLEICVGIAQALSYIHYEELRDFSVIHRNIDSEIVLLNDNWEPKLSEFRLSMKIKTSQRHDSFCVDKVWDREGYTDPTYIETKSANHKSDMYSFGIVMFELLCGRKAVIKGNQDNKYLASVAVAHYREKKLNEMIDWHLWNQMDSQSFNIFAETAYDCLKEERSQRPDIDEIVPRLVKALELARENMPIMSSPNDDLAHLKIPLERILSATNNFDEENIFITSRFCKEYKGQLLWSGELININARRINKERDEGEQEFWMEISMLTSLKHKNVVSLVGFCDEEDEKIIITKYDETRGMLKKYLSDPMLLTWVQRLKISVGLAHTLNYIHYDESHDFSVIHRLISSGRVLLTHDWEPKLCDFQCSMKIKTSQRHHSFHTSKLKYVDGYGDPTYIETNNVNHKSDMYSFGIILFELLSSGRTSIYTNDLAKLIITHYREKKLDNVIDEELWKQIDLHSLNMFTEIVYECLDEERSRRPNIVDIVPRLEKALELAREKTPIHSPPNHLAHLRIPLEDILSPTNYFDGENVIGTGGFGKRYKGQLSWSGELIDITAERLTNKEWDEKEQQFWTEISMLSSLKHKNLVSVVGFCNEGGAETIIYKDESRGRLSGYLSDPALLTWVKRLEICVGIAHALSYIHYDEPRDFSVIHRNISSYTILLNDDWEPKLYQFEHSMKIKACERHLSFHADSVWFTKGYTDPTCLDTNIVNHKSDMYSFGIVLFELLCGRESISDDQDNKFLAPVAIFHYREKTLYDIIDPDLLKQIYPESFNVFTETAYDCLNEERSRCPDIGEVVTRLEEALKLQLERENVEHSVAAAEVEGTSFNHEKGSVTFVSIGNESQVSKNTESFRKDLSHLKLSSQDLISATNNFDEEHIINRDKMIFKGRLLRSKQFIDIIGKAYVSDSEEDESKKFWVELLMLSSLKHKNLVSLIGFYDGEEGKAIIYRREANGSLKKHLSDQTLTWMQRLRICVSVANALSYIHYDAGRDFSVIHCNTRSSKILLDDKWEPKLFGFELALKNTVARRHRLLLTRDIVKNVYLDPKYKETGGVTHKSDVYSFGVVLFEVLCGRSAVYQDEDNDDDEDDDYDDDDDDDDDDEDELGEGLLSQLAKSFLDEMIMPHLRRQMDPEAFKIFSETAYWCIKEERADRPYIDQVFKRLEKALELQWKHENPVNRTSSIQLKVRN